jgi:8-oxo-dGTP diphosphatase
MQTINIRRRGTAIIEIPISILVVAGRRKVYSTRCWGEYGESKTKAAVRELKDESGLIATKVRYLSAT